VRALALELDLVVLPPQGLAESPADDAVTLAAFVPHQLQQLLEAQAPLLSALRAAKAVLVGGAPLSAPQERQLSAVDFPLYHTYGMTETLTHVALRRLNASQRQDAYTALPGVRFEQDERACLIVHSPVVDAPVATRDRVELLGPTRFRYLGRIDNVVVSGGIKIQLERTEVQLRPVLELFFPGQALPRFFLHPQPDERLGQVLVLYVEMPEGAFPRDAVLAKARAELPPYHAPRRVAVLRRFLYTESGKIRRATTAESS
jgi:O-succinylbenzoic acid--CoA ligase